MSPQWLRVSNAAEYASVSKRTIYCWFRQGLKFSKVGGCRLIKVDDLDAFIEQFATTEAEADRLVDEILAEVMP